MACTVHGAAGCASCNAGYRLVGNACQGSAEQLPVEEALAEQVRDQEIAMVRDFIAANETELTMSTGRVTTKVQRLSASSLNPAGDGLLVEVDLGGGAAEGPGPEAKLEVPASVFSKVGEEADGGVLVMVTAFDPTSLPSQEQEGDKLPKGEQESAQKGRTTEVKVVVNVNFASVSTGAYLKVDGLAEPIKVTLPVKRSAGMECAYWDETGKVWATDGLAISEGGPADGRLVCETRHLTLFGGIVRGFANTFACSQVSLLNAAAIAEIAKGDWWRNRAAIFLWGHLGFFLLLMAASLALDSRRSREAVRDEHFLIPLHAGPPDGEAPPEDGSDAADSGDPEQKQGPPGCALWACLGCVVGSVVGWARSSSMLRDALDEVMSSWCESFADARHVTESLWGEMRLLEGGGGGEAGRGALLAARAARALLASSARRLASARAGLSQGCVAFLLEDEDLRGVLLAHRALREGVQEARCEGGAEGVQEAEEQEQDDSHPGQEGIEGQPWQLLEERLPFPSRGSPASPSWMPSFCVCCSTSREGTGAADDDVVVGPVVSQEFSGVVPEVTRAADGPKAAEGSGTLAVVAEAAHAIQGREALVDSAGAPGRAAVHGEKWHKLHKSLRDRLEEQVTHSARCATLPYVFVHTFLVQNPFGAIAVFCNFMSSSLRTLFFMTDVFGTLMLESHFFEATGNIKHKRNRANQSDCITDEVGDKIGRVLVVALAALVLATIPGMFLGSLHVRSLKSYDYEGCPEWKRQLRIWRIQDRIIWVSGALYCGFCIFFVVLFLANVSEEDLDEWIVTGVVSVILDVVVIPCCVCLIVPLLAMTAVSVLCSWKKVRKEEVLEEVRREMIRSVTLSEVPEGTP